MIEVQHLTKRYGNVTAVDDVSFTVEKGEILGFLGPNGAGKTTTMRVLTGYMPATDGHARVAGYDVFDQPIESKRRTGYLPETPPLYPDMTVREYLAFVAKIKGVPAKERAGRLDHVMKRTYIADMAGRACGKLSKGYRQRVGIAQALIHNPDVLILDEPTAGLDPKQIIETRKLIKELAGDHTIVLSTHILPEVAQTCQRVVIINKGRVVAVDTPANLTARLGGSETMFVQADGQADAVRAALAGVPGVTTVTESEVRDTMSSFEVVSQKGTDVRRDLARAIVSGGFGLARAAADAHEPRGNLPLADDGRTRGGRPVTNILAIAHKELRAYFASPIAYVVIGFFALVFGFMFASVLNWFLTQSMQMGMGMGPQTLNVNQQMIRPLLLNMTVVFLLLLPLITMRTYSEEKRSGTIELLLTSPITDCPDHPGQVPGRAGALCRDARCHADSLRCALHVREPRAEAAAHGLSRDAALRCLLHLDRALHLESHEEPDHRGRRHVCGFPPALGR